MQQHNLFRIFIEVVYIRFFFPHHLSFLIKSNLLFLRFPLSSTKSHFLFIIITFLNYCFCMLWHLNTGKTCGKHKKNHWKWLFLAYLNYTYNMCIELTRVCVKYRDAIDPVLGFEREIESIDARFGWNFVVKREINVFTCVLRPLKSFLILETFLQINYKIETGVRYWAGYSRHCFRKQNSGILGFQLHFRSDFVCIQWFLWGGRNHYLCLQSLTNAIKNYKMQ